jgi:hypothetical protein
MIFRAVFWIGLVSLLTPHEPDLGLGRPGAGISQITPAALLSSASGLSRTGLTCGSACAGGLGLPAFQINPSIGNGLADVKAQIEADQKTRALHSHAI